MYIYIVGLNNCVAGENISTRDFGVFLDEKSIEFSTTACKVHVMSSVMSCADNDCCSTVVDGNASIRDIILHMTHDCTACKIQETLADGNVSIHDFLEKYNASIYICYKSNVVHGNVSICNFCDM